VKQRLLLLLALVLFSAQSIEEKKASLIGRPSALAGADRDRLTEVNDRILAHRGQLRFLFEEAERLHQTGASERQFRTLLKQIGKVRDEISVIQSRWRDEAAHTGKEEAYALWHQPWTTIEQLIMDYGSQDYVYLIPPEVRGLQLSVASNLPIPRESWDEMLQLILAHNGVGVRQLNPFLRQLYLSTLDQSEISFITSDRNELRTIPTKSRVCFVLTPSGPDIHAVHDFLGRFIDPMTSSIHSVGGQLFLLSSIEGINQTLKLYDFIEANCGKREYALIPLTRISAEEMSSILSLYFLSSSETDLSRDSSSSSGPRILALPNLASSLFVAGSEQEVTQARQLCRELEAQVEDPHQMTVYWYRVKHSDPLQLADILAQVYGLLTGDLVEQGFVAEGEGGGGIGDRLPGQCPTFPCVPTYDPAMIAVKPPPVTTRQPQQIGGDPVRAGNFITDPKTGTIIMVVQQDMLSQLKCLLRRLDIPKRMVQIDVLLVEKKIVCASKFGLDLLRIGDNASNTNRFDLDWDNRPGARQHGILSFFLSQAKSHAFPAWDILYHFMMSQEDMRINNNPSVTTVNQTPASIRLVEEISLDMGAFIDPDQNNTILGRSFTRAQYGIQLNITPTINEGVDENGFGPFNFITLNTDVLFDTPQETHHHHSDRPRVLRRQISNQVRIEDGQTVILGGLRSKIAEDRSTSLPFLGELPGIGKFFSSTQMKDNSTEMFIFITPHIVIDPEEEMRCFLCRRMRERPGDLPEWLDCLERARCYQRGRTFCRSLQILFGQPKNYFCCQ
jgi:general secretion pathway protein D